MEKAVGYIRVSSPFQVKNESLAAQKEAIRRYCDAFGLELMDVCADEGISGKRSENRPALNRLLSDARHKGFNAAIVRTIARFGRNMVESLNNAKVLSDNGIRLISLQENVDFSSTIGKIILGVLAGFAQYENEERAAAAMASRILKVKKGLPAVPRLPFARTYNKEENRWELGEKLASMMRWAADQYVNQNSSIINVASDLKTLYGYDISPDRLRRILRNCCGGEWVVKVGGQEYVLKVPRILDDEMIERVRATAERNSRNNKVHVYRKYALSGFLRCAKCLKTLRGQTQYGKYIFYQHPPKKDKPCDAGFASVKLQRIEDAVFRKIFENTIDEVGFSKAIKDALPNPDHIKAMKVNIVKNEKRLAKVENDLRKLVDLAMNGTLRKETLREKEEELYQAKAKLIEEIEGAKQRLNSLPTVKQLEKEAEFLRRSLMIFFQSPDRYSEMSYEEKRQLLNFLFEGKDAEGVPYGVYIDKIGIDEWDIFIYGCLISDGRRTSGTFSMKGDDLDYEKPDILKEIEEIRAKGANEGPESSEAKKKVVLDRRKMRDLPLEGPQYPNWLEYIKQGEDYTTSDVIQVL
jgi:DNA invertase Pin-like site-specific DNA recombinase